MNALYKTGATTACNCGLQISCKAAVLYQQGNGETCLTPPIWMISCQQNTGGTNYAEEIKKKY